jgi:hypothetical protein
LFCCRSVDCSSFRSSQLQVFLFWKVASIFLTFSKRFALCLERIIYFSKCYGCSIVKLINYWTWAWQVSVCVTPFDYSQLWWSHMIPLIRLNNMSWLPSTLNVLVYSKSCFVFHWIAITLGFRTYIILASGYDERHQKLEKYSFFWHSRIWWSH